MDENGKLHILGRKKNMIVMDNGEKVLCTDVDEALSALPAIADGAVIYKNKQLIAVVAPEKKVTEQQVEEAISEYNRMQPYYRRIKKIWIYGNALPYTSSGKLHRSRLEREYDSQHDSIL